MTQAALGPWAQLQAYLAVARSAARTILVYRAQMILSVVAILLRLALLFAIWRAVYRQESPGALALADLLDYLVVANLQLWLFVPRIGFEISRMVRTGEVLFLFVRPIPILGNLLARQVGYTGGTASVPLVIALAVIVLTAALRPPADPAAAALYVLSAALAYCVGVLISLLIGVGSFWTVEITGLYSIYRFVADLFGGALIPLLLMPNELRALAQLLPFQAQGHIPASVYVGTLSGAPVLGAIALQLAWVLLLGGLVLALWRAAKRRVTIQGG